MKSLHTFSIVFLHIITFIRKRENAGKSNHNMDRYCTDQINAVSTSKNKTVFSTILQNKNAMCSTCIYVYIS